MWHGSQKDGFTLLELLIVCLLISISLAFAIPTLLSSFGTDELGSASRKVIALLKSSRSQAVTRHIAILIYYDPDQGRLWYQAAESNEGPPLPHSSITLPAGVRIDSIQQASGAATTANHSPGPIWISPKGYMDKTAIYLVDRSNKGISLVVSPFLPTIKVLEGRSTP